MTDHRKEQLSRTALLLGDDAVERLSQARVAVFGVGGVGGFAAEALARSGIGALDLIDGDVVSLSNLNRQIIALHSTVGKAKTEVMAQRIQDIDPDIRLTLHTCFFTPENAGDFDFTQYDYIIDAVDMVTAKIQLAVQAQAAGVPIISSMGAGNKLDPSAFEVSDLYKTSVCPLARVMRRELKVRGIRKMKVVYSKEEPRKVDGPTENGRHIPGSIAFVPSAAGLVLAGEVIRELAGL
ncbi:MAG TPA: tRNA threonylcarbamoyladenosine dehydratase [Firmicutes bacterium]|nr:tRNA threonylcarbamoyladenosine dehydratase [Bacillota bacterium]